MYKTKQIDVLSKLSCRKKKLIIRQCIHYECAHVQKFGSLILGLLEELSNTLFFEENMNYEGVLIEGHPQNAEALMARRGRSGRNVVFSSAVCYHSVQSSPVQFSSLAVECLVACAK